MNHNHRLPELSLLPIPQPDPQATIKRLLALGAKQPVTLTLNVKLPLRDWHDLACAAETKGFTLERAVSSAIVGSDWYDEASDLVRNRQADEVAGKAIGSNTRDDDDDEERTPIPVIKTPEGETDDPENIIDRMADTYGLTLVIDAPISKEKDQDWIAVAISAAGSVFEIRDGDHEPHSLSINESIVCVLRSIVESRDFSFGEGYVRWLELVCQTFSDNRGTAD